MDVNDHPLHNKFYSTLKEQTTNMEKFTHAFPVRGSQAFSTAYIHTQNITEFHEGIKPKTPKNNQFGAHHISAPCAIPPTTPAQQHTHHNKHRQSVASAAAPDQSRLDFWLVTLLHGYSSPSPPKPPDAAIGCCPTAIDLNSEGINQTKSTNNKFKFKSQPTTSNQP
jgi:hypothetical protein